MIATCALPVQALVFVGSFKEYATDFVQEAVKLNSELPVNCGSYQTLAELASREDIHLAQKVNARLSTLVDSAACGISSQSQSVEALDQMPCQHFNGQLVLN